MITRECRRRFYRKFLVGDGCWEWTGAVGKGGYGNFCADGRYTNAHRVSYELFVGPIPEGMHLDHLCRNKRCVNPAHLEPVTPRENTRRGVVSAVQKARHAAVTHCPQGHAYDEANTYTYRGRRYCRACGRESTRRYRERRSNG